MIWTGANPRMRLISHEAMLIVCYWSQLHNVENPYNYSGVFTLNCIKKQDKDPTYKDEKMNTINYKIHSKNTWHDIRYVLSRIIRIAHRKTKDEEMGRRWINKHLQDK